MSRGVTAAEIRAFLQAEIEILDEMIVRGMTVIDVGFGTGRHLARFHARLGLGVGVDYEHAYEKASTAIGMASPSDFFAASLRLRVSTALRAASRRFVVAAL
jgi:hypothetical protein